MSLFATATKRFKKPSKVHYSQYIQTEDTPRKKLVAALDHRQAFIGPTRTKKQVVIAVILPDKRLRKLQE
jgi:hypothetical protein